MTLEMMLAEAMVMDRRRQVEAALRHAGMSGSLETKSELRAQRRNRNHSLRLLKLWRRRAIAESRVDPSCL